MSRGDARPDRLKVDLGARSYDIVIGPAQLARLGDHIRAFALTGRVAVITDETVAGLYGEAIDHVQFGRDFREPLYGRL